MKNQILSLISLAILIFSACSTTKNSTSANANRNGNSYENAIIVSSIPEEYEWAQKQCNDCEFVQQALSFHEKKPYDILTFKKPNGEEVRYYFDISSFYGKW